MNPWWWFNSSTSFFVVLNYCEWYFRGCQYLTRSAMSVNYCWRNSSCIALPLGPIWGLSPQAEKLKKLTDSVDETGDGTKSQWSILGGRFTEGMNEISPRNGDFTTGIWPCHAMSCHVMAMGPVGPMGPMGTVDFTNHRSFPFSERLITRVNLGLIFQHPWFPMVSGVHLKVM